MPYIIVRENNIPKCIEINNASSESSSKVRYISNDLCSVYIHWDSTLKRNIPTENTLKGDVSNGKSSK